MEALTSRQKKALETREKLLKTSLDLFNKHGYEHVSVEQITKACNVSKGTFYTHFPSKYDVILEKFKEKYYHNTNKEKKYFEVKNNIWKELNTIGNINDNIEMELVKASYEDKILSLRYVITTNGILDSIYMASPFTEKLLKKAIS